MDEQTRRELDQHERRLLGAEAVALQSTAAAMQVDELARDMVEVKAGIERLHERISRRDRDDAERREAALKAEIARAKASRDEKKKDRRWMIGSVLTAAGIVIAAVALLLNTGAPA